jgi:hypothetical protein
VAFVFIGSTKFDNDPNGMWVKLFEQIGFGQWFRYFTGAMQVGGAPAAHSVDVDHRCGHAGVHDGRRRVLHSGASCVAHRSNDCPAA